MKIEATLQIVGGTARLQATIVGDSGAVVRFDTLGESADAVKMVSEMLKIVGVEENTCK